MGLSRRGTGGIVAVVAALLALPVSANASTTRTLTVTGAATGSCATSEPAGGRGVATTRWTAPTDSSVRAAIADGAGDWDLALFDAASGRRLDASQAWGSNEVVQAIVRQGQAVTVQACRLSGGATSKKLAIDSVPVTFADRGGVAPKQRLVQIPIDGAIDIQVLNRLGINLNEAPEGDTVSAIISGAHEAGKLAGAGYTFTVLDPDVAATRRRQAQADVQAAQEGPSVLPSGRRTYRTYTDIQNDLKEIAAQNPTLARAITLPKKSFQGRDINGIELSANVNRRDDGKPAFFLMGAHHAREWPSAEIPIEYALYLIQNYGKDPRVTRLMKRVRVFVVPVINPDGYIASRSATDPADLSGDPGSAPSLAESVAPPGGSLAYRRKNCRGTSPDPATPCEFQHGVDPNRNYGQNWGGPGASVNPLDQDYRGTDMWSETETQAVHEFSRSHDITTLVTMHNFASLVLRPPGVDDEGPAPDEVPLKKLGDAMAEAAGYTSQYSYQLYDTSGTTEDWNYAAAGTYGYTIEMGPTSEKGGNFHISYDRGVVNQWTGEETRKGKGKGLREALLLAGETAADRTQFSTLSGTAPPGSVLRLRKEFKTLSAKEICLAETTGVDCTGNVDPQRSQDDFLDYTTVVRGNGRFNWVVTPSTRPFELKAGRTEKWTLTCENPVSGQVQERRLIEVDRGQRVEMDLTCGGKAAQVDTRRCLDKRKFRFHVHPPHKGRITRVHVFVNGKRRLVRKGAAARRKFITLKGLRARRGRFRVTFVVFTSDGKQHITTRIYKGCKKGKPRGVVRNTPGRRR
jgi:hypothetical protein